MHLIARTLIALVSLLLAGGTAAQPVPQAHPLTGATGTNDSYYNRVGEVIAHDATPQQQAQVDKAVALFEHAGLGLPATDIFFHDSTEPCNGNAGLHHPPAVLGGLVHRIDICHRLPMFLVHELAHAWSEIALDESDRQAALDRWGLEAWNDHDLEWIDRGTERVAQTVTYTLMADGPAVSDDVAEFICSYEAVTGSTHDAMHDQQCAV